MPRRSATRELVALDEALDAMRRALQRPAYLQRLQEEVGPSISFAVLRVLRAIERSPSGTSSVGQLADSLGLDRSTVSRFVDRCVALELVTRRPVAGDGRRIDLLLSAAGEDVVARATELRRKVLAEVTKDWTGPELNDATSSFHRLLDGFDRATSG